MSWHIIWLRNIALDIVFMLRVLRSSFLGRLWGRRCLIIEEEVSVRGVSCLFFEDGPTCSLWWAFARLGEEDYVGAATGC
jgi:hypothetical protein